MTLHDGPQRPPWPGHVGTWSFPLTAAGVRDLHAAASSIRVCPDLPVGRYLFVCSAVGT